MESITKNFFSNTKIPKFDKNSNNYKQLIAYIKNKQITDCLEILASRGLHGDVAIFILANACETMEVKQ